MNTFQMFFEWLSIAWQLIASLSSEVCRFLSRDLSQSSAAMHLRCGGIFTRNLWPTAKSAGERILKIDRHLAKLAVKVEGHLLRTRCRPTIVSYHICDRSLKPSLVPGNPARLITQMTKTSVLLYGQSQQISGTEPKSRTYKDH